MYLLPSVCVLTYVLVGCAVLGVAIRCFGEEPDQPRWLPVAIWPLVVCLLFFVAFIWLCDSTIDWAGKDRT